MFKFIIFLFICFSISGINAVFADCNTGYACSIESLEEMRIQRDIEAKGIIESIFSKKLKEPSFINKKITSSDYKDLFTFNIFV